MVNADNCSNILYEWVFWKFSCLVHTVFSKQKWQRNNTLEKRKKNRICLRSYKEFEINTATTAVS